MEAATPAPAQGPRKIEVGRVLKEAFTIYGENVGALLGIGILISVAFGIIIGLLNEEGGVLAQFIASVLQLIAGALYTGFVVRLVMDVRDGRRDSSVGELVSSATPFIGSLIVFSFLSGIGIVIGFILLIIPGLYLMTIWSVGAPAIVVERKSGLEAFSRSHELVKGQGWDVFFVIVCVFLIILASGIVAAAIGAAIGGVIGAIIVASVVLLFYMPVQALVQSVLFFDLGGGSTPAPADSQTVVEY
jgi:hypothetical protein